MKTSLMQSVTKQNALAVLIILLTGGVFFYPSLFFDFTYSLDDQWLIVENPAIKDFSWHGIKYLFLFDNRDHHYHPLTYLSYMLDYRLFGANPMMIRAHSVLLHILNALLIYVLVKRWSALYWIALVTALLFLIQPMNIDSVVWTSCRRQSLFLFHLQLSIIAIDKCATNRSQGYRTSLFWLIMAYFFWVLATLAKASAITLPVLWLAVWYYRKAALPVWRNIILIALTCMPVFMYLTYRNAAEAIGNNITRSFDFSNFEHFIFICYSYSFYFFKWLIPYKLSLFYPAPSELEAVLPYKYYAAVAGVVLIATLFVYHLYKREGLPVLLLVLYSVTIAPTLNLMVFLYSNLPMVVSNRYFYLSGIFVIGYFLLLLNKLVIRKPIRILVVSILLLNSTLAFFSYLPSWENDFTALHHATDLYPNEALLHRLAIQYQKSGNDQMAITQIKRADSLNLGIWIQSDFVFYLDRSALYFKDGQFDKALKDLEYARSRPTDLNVEHLFTLFELIYKKVPDAEICSYLMETNIEQGQLEYAAKIGVLDFSKYKQCAD